MVRGALALMLAMAALAGGCASESRPAADTPTTLVTTKTCASPVGGMDLASATPPTRS